MRTSGPLARASKAARSLSMKSGQMGSKLRTICWQSIDLILNNRSALAELELEKSFESERDQFEFNFITKFESHAAASAIKSQCCCRSSESWFILAVRFTIVVVVEVVVGVVVVAVCGSANRRQIKH